MSLKAAAWYASAASLLSTATELQLYQLREYPFINTSPSLKANKRNILAMHDGPRYTHKELNAQLRNSGIQSSSGCIKERAPRWNAVLKDAAERKEKERKGRADRRIGCHMVTPSWWPATASDVHLDERESGLQLRPARLLRMAKVPCFRQLEPCRHRGPCASPSQSPPCW